MPRSIDGGEGASDVTESMVEKAALLAREAEAFAGWSAAIAGVDPEAQRSDGWTLREVVAHLAAWQRLTAARLERLADGVPTDAPDWDAFNADVRARAAGQSWAAVSAEAEAARAALRATVERLPQSALESHDALGAFLVESNGVEHYAEHLGDFAAPSAG